ncbi:HAD hydrolase-like protein [Luteibacter sp. 621]|uniref:HAD hydrolase-like protein n=1 Tax=Luteibacter sp. 621 TaxID=3373916 RepID=UPI003D19DFA6
MVSELTDALARVSRRGRAQVDHSLTHPEADTFMIGDRRYDTEGAVANHVRGVGVLWGFGDRAELEQAAAWTIVEKPADLLGLA